MGQETDHSLVIHYAPETKKKYIKALSQGVKTTAVDAYAFFIDEFLAGNVNLTATSEWLVELLDNGSGRIEISYPNKKGRQKEIKIYTDPQYTACFCAINLRSLENPYICNLEGDLFPTDKKYCLDEDIEDIENNAFMKFLCSVADLNYDDHMKKISKSVDMMNVDNHKVEVPAPVQVKEDTSKIDKLELENQELKSQLSKIEGMLLMMNPQQSQKLTTKKTK
jgi:hypothetical protein